jgi:hypothetical protein
MDAVCHPAEREESALSTLADHLCLEPGQLRSELLYLKAFAVDFAVSLSLGECPERNEILDLYYGHWEHIASQSDAGVLDDLHDRVSYYSDAATSLQDTAHGLNGQVGQAFADRFGAADRVEDLTLVGGEMFGALFAEVTDLFHSVNIVPFRAPTDSN